VLYYVSIFALVVAVVGAGGTFGYKAYLDTVTTARQLRLEAAEKSIDPAAVEDYIRLRNRIKVANVILNRHIVTSQFFTTLESLTLQNVRFQTLQLDIEDDRTAAIEMQGSARSFNALAAQSAAFANEKQIKRAIFSGITADKNGVVKFSLSAELGPKLVLTTPEAVAAEIPPPVNIATTSAPFPEPVATTTPATKATTTP
jgi:Tfp pilus assembly protein PilN